MQIRSTGGNRALKVRHWDTRNVQLESLSPESDEHQKSKQPDSPISKTRSKKRRNRQSDSFIFPKRDKTLSAI